MEKKVREMENIKLLEKALSLLKHKKDILSYSCNRSFSYGGGENINLNIEFEIPNDVSFNIESSSSSLSDSKCSSSKSTSTNDDVKVYTSTITPSSGSSIPPESCQDVKEDDEVMKNNANYQALNTLSESQRNVYVEIIVYIRTYVQNNMNDGILERIDIELNPFRVTPREIIKTVLPDKDPIKIMGDGMYFTRKDFDCVRDQDKQQNWIACYPYEMDMSLVKIYGSTSLNDFKMSFVIDDISKV
uniref:Doublecortin domain-containing protein n=1 Tax=Strongyloides papillosus TaxID=174720 RepID=A0A0N5CGN4_STREA